MKKMDKKLTRQYFDVKDACFGAHTEWKDGVLTISKEELQAEVAPLLKAVKSVDFELVKPGENARIIHLLDTLQPMFKVEGEGTQYSGYFSDPLMVGEGTTNLLRGLTVMESAALPWDESSASSGLLYPRDAIMDMTGPIAGITPFAQTINMVILYELEEGKSSIEYDNEIRSIGVKIASFLGEATKDQTPDESEVFSIDEVNPDLPNVVLVWNSQNQGPYSNTYIYGHPIDLYRTRRPGGGGLDRQQPFHGRPPGRPGLLPGGNRLLRPEKAGKGHACLPGAGGRHRPALRKRQGNLRAARDRLTF